jgi:hypothetical protein
MKTDKNEFLLRVLIALLLGFLVAYISLNNETKVYIWEKLQSE